MIDNEESLLLSSSSSSSSRIKRYEIHDDNLNILNDNDNNDSNINNSNRNILNRILIFVAISVLIIVALSNSKNINNGRNILLNFNERKSSSSSSIVFDPWSDLEDTNNNNDKSIIDYKSKVTPNFVFILADDLGYNSLGYDDNDIDFATPFMTKMAKKGIKLTNYYSQEVCTPARASLLTGRYPVTIGMQYGDVDLAENWGLPIGETLLSNVLQDEGYKTYAVGKWNLGHYSPRYLPTARGFDYFIGFLTGQSYHWSKRVPQYKKFKDMLYANADCYAPYDGDDLHKYSTFFYRDKAIDIIEAHNFKSHPMFMYLSLQAVHDPFFDDRIYPAGIPKKYIGSSMYSYVKKKVVGRKRRQYTYALILIDRAVSEIYQAISKAGVKDETYFIFASDNGGCYQAGGKNGPLRGSKGTLFEGGTKVDAFIQSPLIPKKLHGTEYSGVMHVSDWFPTILDLAGINYKPDDDYKLDGVSQKIGFKYGESSNPRDFMLYNYYTNVDAISNFKLDINAPAAIRDQQFKLIHSFVDNPLSDWYQSDERNDDDSILDISGTCSQSEAISGTYTKFFFDLKNDPYETTNLYDDAEYADQISKLYSKLDDFKDIAAEDTHSGTDKKAAFKAWKKADNWIVPWVKSSDLKNKNTYPDSCTFKHEVVSPDYNDNVDDDFDYDDSFDDDGGSSKDDWNGDDYTPFPSAKPSHKPTYSPTRKPSDGPTTDPTHKPTYSPTKKPTAKPSRKPTKKPTRMPTKAQQSEDIDLISTSPSVFPLSPSYDDDDVDDDDDNKDEETPTPTHKPSRQPTTSVDDETHAPSPSTYDPDFTHAPSLGEEMLETAEPSHKPTHKPTHDPTYEPTIDETASPSHKPTHKPTHDPTYEPTTDDDAVVFTHAPSPTTYDPDLTHAPTPVNEILIKLTSDTILNTIILSGSLEVIEVVKEVLDSKQEDYDIVSIYI